MEQPASRPTRLINAVTLRVEKTPSQAPRYAILSHTWGKQEVSLRDLARGDLKDRLGYAKIVGACEQAKKDGLTHVWVDTCCIKREDSTELTEAINSMYAWYKGATVCFVLLSDVPSEDVDLVDISRTRILGAVRESRWFTRGWTLQELLAPHEVQFFSRDWTHLGSLNDLLQTIAETTKIDASVLRHQKPVAECSVAQRLSWASARQTTRLEDIAYCLLGILDINLSPMYGEGQKAFQRLQEEVLKSSGDLSILAWSHTNKSQSGHLLASSPNDFEHSSTIVTDRSNTNQSEYWTTNLGLKVTLSIIDHQGADGRPGRVLALLGCHYEASPQDTLALRLTAAGSLGKDADRTFSVSPQDDEATSSSKLARLENVSLESRPDISRTQATILKVASKGVTLYNPREHDTSYTKALAINQAKGPGSAKAQASTTSPLSMTVDASMKALRHESERRNEEDRHARSVPTGSGSASHVPRSVIPSSVMSMIGSVQAPFIYRVDELRPSKDSRKRVDVNGDWLPPRPLGSNRITAAGTWLYCSGVAGQGSMPFSPAPGQNAPNILNYKTYSMYCVGHTFWILPYDASSFMVGDGSQKDGDSSSEEEEPTEESESDDSDSDEPSAQHYMDWSLLGFPPARHPIDQYTSYASYGAAQGTRLLMQRSDQDVWVNELLPDRYHSTMRVQGNAQNAQYGGMVGDLPVLLGLIAFSARPEDLTSTLAHCVHGSGWRTHGGRRASGWLNRRGLVIRTYVNTANPHSTLAGLAAFENGLHGKVYP